MLKKLLVVLGVIVGIVAVLGIFAPSEFTVEKEVIVNKSKDVVFSHIKKMGNQNRWSPWIKKDPNMNTEILGTDGTIGATYTWAGNSEVGVGEQEIKNITEGERIDYELRFKEPMESTAQAYLMTEFVSENETKVKWGMRGQNRFPGNVVCLLFNMKESVGKEFQTGLDSLKVVLETFPD